jgi:hypothetical protein
MAHFFHPGDEKCGAGTYSKYQEKEKGKTTRTRKTKEENEKGETVRRNKGTDQRFDLR